MANDTVPRPCPHCGGTGQTTLGYNDLTAGERDAIKVLAVVTQPLSRAALRRRLVPYPGFLGLIRRRLVHEPRPGYYALTADGQTICAGLDRAQLGERRGDGLGR